MNDDNVLYPTGPRDSCTCHRIGPCDYCLDQHKCGKCYELFYDPEREFNICESCYKNELLAKKILKEKEVEEVVKDCTNYAEMMGGSPVDKQHLIIKL